MFIKGIRYVVGNGRRVQFAEDKWCGDNPHKVDFLELFRIAYNKEAKVGDYLTRNG